MPIYEYRCSDCGHRLEALQRLADAPLVLCPACSKESLVKLISAVGFQLKGSGWYATDFKNYGAKPAEKSTTKSDSDAKSGDSASDAKSGDAARKEAKSADAAAPGSKSEAKPVAQPASGDSKSVSTDTKASAPATPSKPAPTAS